MTLKFIASFSSEALYTQSRYMYTDIVSMPPSSSLETQRKKCVPPGQSASFRLGLRESPIFALSICIYSYLSYMLTQCFDQASIELLAGFCFALLGRQRVCGNCLRETQAFSATLDSSEIYQKLDQGFTGTSVLLASMAVRARRCSA